MTTTSPHAACQTCTHAADEHSPLAGCMALDGNTANPCPCTEFLPAAGQPNPAAPNLGGTTPARGADPETSHKATHAVIISAGNQRTLLLAGFGHYSDDGATDEEAAETAEGVALTSEFAKRASELREGGFIVTTGEERTGHSGQSRMVSAITDKGLAALEGVGIQRPRTKTPRSKLTDAEAALVRRVRGMTGATHPDHAQHPDDRLVILRETLTDVVRLIDRLS